MFTKEKFYNEVSLKKLVSFNTHDGYAYSCDFFIGKTKIAHIENDGNGGCTDYHFENQKAEEILYDFIEKHNIFQFMFEHGYEFVEIVDKITIEDFFANWVEDEMQEKENRKLINRLQKKSIVFGDINTGILNEIRYKYPISEIVAYGHKEKIQAEIDKLKSAGKQILNTNLQELGLIV